MLSKQRQVGYAGLKNWLRNGAEIDSSKFEVKTVGELYYDEYQDPPESWGRTIDFSTSDSYFIALAIPNGKGNGAEVKPVLRFFDHSFGLNDLKRNHKVLMLVQVTKVRKQKKYKYA